MNKLHGLALASAVTLAACHPGPKMVTAETTGVSCPLPEHAINDQKKAEELYAQSVLLNDHIDYYRRQLAVALGQDKAWQEFQTCSDDSCYKQSREKFFAMTGKLDDKSMGICFQDGDYDTRCLEGTLLRQFGKEYIDYMAINNQCKAATKQCLEKKVGDLKEKQPKKGDSNYNPEGI